MSVDHADTKRCPQARRLCSRRYMPREGLHAGCSVACMESPADPGTGALVYVVPAAMMGLTTCRNEGKRAWFAISQRSECPTNRDTDQVQCCCFRCWPLSPSLVYRKKKSEKRYQQALLSGSSKPHFEVRRPRLWTADSPALLPPSHVHGSHSPPGHDSCPSFIIRTNCIQIRHGGPRFRST